MIGCRQCAVSAINSIGVTRDLVTGCDLAGLLRVGFEEGPRLQRLHRGIVGCACEMKVGRIVAGFHAAIGDPTLQLRVSIDRGNEMNRAISPCQSAMAPPAN
jgi:hypothetical protein